MGIDLLQDVVNLPLAGIKVVTEEVAESREDQEEEIINIIKIKDLN
jgi:hypothetical protein